MTIETKYDVEDEVWYIHKNQVRKSQIKEIVVHKAITSTFINYKLEGELFSANRLFETKEELIASL